MNPQHEEIVMTFFRALVDVERLKIVGLLAIAPRTVAEVADLLQLKPMRASNHLDQLVHAGVAAQQGVTYHLAGEAVQQMAKEVLAGSRPALKAEDLDGPEYDRKVLSSFLNPDGTLKQLPNQQKKLLVVLSHVILAFEPGVRYPEKTVNDKLKRYYADFASLRRYLVDNGLLARESGVYWRV
jgi:DNA-binding transcriptional ArsR family regulator